MHNQKKQPTTKDLDHEMLITKRNLLHIRNKWSVVGLFIPSAVHHTKYYYIDKSCTTDIAQSFQEVQIRQSKSPPYRPTSLQYILRGSVCRTKPKAMSLMIISKPKSTTNLKGRFGKPLQWVLSLGFWKKGFLLNRSRVGFLLSLVGFPLRKKSHLGEKLNSRPAWVPLLQTNSPGLCFSGPRNLWNRQQTNVEYVSTSLSGKKHVVAASYDLSDDCRRRGTWAITEPHKNEKTKLLVPSWGSKLWRVHFARRILEETYRAAHKAFHQSEVLRCADWKPSQIHKTSLQPPGNFRILLKHRSNLLYHLYLGFQRPSNPPLLCHGRRRISQRWIDGLGEVAAGPFLLPSRRCSCTKTSFKDLLSFNVLTFCLVNNMNNLS